MADNFYAKYPVTGAGPGGEVTSLNGLTGDVTISAGAGITLTPTGNDIEISASAATPGTPNTFAGYDNSGNLTTIPGHSFDAATFGDILMLDAPLANTGSYTLNTSQFNIIPSVNSPNDSIVLETENIFVDPTSTGLQIGTNGDAFNAKSIFVQHHGTSDTGTMVLRNDYVDLGNGTDPITIANFQYHNMHGDINDNTTISGQLSGMGFAPAVHSGAVLSQGIRAFFDNANIAAPIADYVSFSANPAIDTILTGYNVNAYQAGGNFTTLAGNAGYQGLTVSPTITTLGTGGFQGININPAIANAGSGYIAGINIAMGNVLNSTGDLPYTINTQGGRAQIQSIATGTQSGTYLSTMLDTGDYTIPAGVFGLNGLGGQFHIASGSPIASGAFGIGNNLGIEILAEDDMQPDSSGFGLGFVMNGFLTQVGVANTKTMDSVTFMGAGASVSTASTGGTLNDVNMFRAVGIVPGGGTLAINNIVGFKVDSLLTSSSPTNAWGFRVDDANADNWFAKNLVVGGSTMHPTSASAGLEVAGTTSALLLSRMATADRDALTAVNGMQIYNTDTNTLQAYVNGVWGDIGGGGSTTLANNTFFNARNAANTADIPLFKLTNADEFILVDSAGHNLIDLESKTISSTDGNTVMYWDQRKALDSNSNIAIDWANRTLSDDQTGAPNALNWKDRILFNVVGSQHALEWATDFVVKTFDTQGSGTNNISLSTGDDLAGVNPTGTINILTGSGSGAPASGAINIKTGPNVSTGNTGTVVIQSGDSTANASGNVSLQSGTAGDISGDINIASAPAGASGAGIINIKTGDIALAGSSGGSVSIKTGDNLSTTGYTAEIDIATGEADDNTNTGATGTLNIKTGDNFGAAGATTGDVNINTGICPSGTRGAVRIDALVLACPRHAADPTGSFSGGEIYFNTTINKLKVYGASAWETITSV